MITIGTSLLLFGRVCRVGAHDTNTLNVFQQRRCPECGGTVFVTDKAAGEVTCRACGLVLIDDLLDRTPEWRAFTSEEWRRRMRTGAPASLRWFDKGLSTTFLPNNDSSGKQLPPSVRYKMQRLQRWQHRARTQASRDRNLAQAMTELTRLADTLNIPPDVTENAARIYRKALQNDLVRGRSIHGITAASLYLACRQMRLPRKLNLFAEASSRTPKEVSRSVRVVLNALGLTLPIDTPEKYLSKIVSTLGLPQCVQNTALTIIQTAHQHHAIVGKSPVGIAAATIYLAARVEDIPVTQQKIAAVAGVTEVTVRNRYHDIVHVLNLDLVKS
jgi:transcription initiation factor TFIIB